MSKIPTICVAHTASIYDWALADRTGKTRRNGRTNQRAFIFELMFWDLIASTSRKVGSARFVGSAWGRIPPGFVRNLFEMRMGEERLDQILGIGRHCRDRQPGAATIRVREGIEVLFQHRISAVRNSVLLQISWTQMGGYDL